MQLHQNFVLQPDKLTSSSFPQLSHRVVVIREVPQTSNVERRLGRDSIIEVRYYNKILRLHMSIADLWIRPRTLHKDADSLSSGLGVCSGRLGGAGETESPE